MDKETAVSTDTVVFYIRNCASTVGSFHDIISKEEYVLVMNSGYPAKIMSKSYTGV